MVITPTFSDKLLASTPFSEVVVKPVAPGAIVFDMHIPRINKISQKLSNKNAPVVVKLDGWPNRRIGKRVFIRIGAQGIGCGLRCMGCDAAELPGYNLSASEIVFQVLEVIRTQAIDLSRVEKLTIAFMGTGEPLLNPSIIPALERLHELFPDARFIVSTTGPKKGRNVFRALMALVASGFPLWLQISLNETDQGRRIAYTQDQANDGELKYCWSIPELSDRTSEFFEAAKAKKKVHLNLLVTEDSEAWKPIDYGDLDLRFGSARHVAKVSVEGKKGSAILEKKAQDRLNCLLKRGWGAYIYDPVGNREGAGCASLVVIQ